MKYTFALVIPLANEASTFYLFIRRVQNILDLLEKGSVYLVVDHVSKDTTLDLCNDLSDKDERFITVWSPGNKGVVDAYYKRIKKP